MKPLVALILLPFAAGAIPITGASLTFDGLKSGEQILAYYAGGLGSLGSGPGPSFGISFSTGLAADPTAIAFGPSALVTGSSVTMSLDAPYNQLLSFYFTGNGTISFYSGPNATGTLLAAATLVYPPFFPFAAGPGVFQSVVFTPVSGSTLRLDSVTLGGEVVIPEPSAFLLLAAGALSIATLKRFRHR